MTIRNLYLTADQLSIKTGGGNVTAQEWRAFSEFSLEHAINPVCWQRKDLDNPSLPEPWKWDQTADSKREEWAKYCRFCHGYAGTFSQTIKELKKNNCKVSWTVAAHDVKVSRQEHEKLGMGFPYEHLTNSKLFAKYIEGYLLSDVIICPSTVAANTVRNYNNQFANKRIEVIPHGCDIPDKVVDPPKTFVVGYFGTASPDKGTRYLLEAWKKLDWKDSTLILAGGGSDNDLVRELKMRLGLPNVVLKGPVDNPQEFYDGISCLINTSATEGFGMPVLEAMASARMVLCSKGAGAQDIVPPECRFNSCSLDEVAGALEYYKNQGWEAWKKIGENNREIAKNFRWEAIRNLYKRVWGSLLWPR
jgi:glycosyltransferase involved in cell wall biosynthesis